MGTTTILIVDDEPASLSLLRHLLRPFHRVLTANSGENALRPAASEPRPTLALLDVMTAIVVQFNDRVNPER
jgi:CheY-like chemotaxis protein